MNKISILALSGLLACAAQGQTLTNAVSAQPAAGGAQAAPAAAKKQPTRPRARATLQSAPAAVALRPGPATVKADTLNVRGQARLNSERVASLKQGDQVTVLEEIVLDKPNAGEPARWARIALPADVKVWVNGLFIDPTNKTVLPNRLNLRAGPGENFSVLGLLEKGDLIHEAGAVSGDWIQIEAPTNAYAFVASEHLKQEPLPIAPPTPPAPALAETKTVAAPPSIPAPPPTPTQVAEPPAIAPPAAQPAEPPPAEPAVFTPIPPSAAAPASADAIERARAAVRRKIAELDAQERGGTPPAVAPAEPAPPRIVSHEGVVRRTWSIQAPTPYALVDPASGRTVNYLYTTSTNLDLSKYRGLRIIVTGEEGLDERWRSTPVLTIQRIHVLE